MYTVQENLQNERKKHQHKNAPFEQLLELCRENAAIHR